MDVKQIARVLFWAAALGLMVIVGEMFLTNVRDEAKKVIKNG